MVVQGGIKRKGQIKYHHVLTILKKYELSMWIIFLKEIDTSYRK